MTSTRNVLGPTVPGVIVSRTRIVVAKSLPVTTTLVGAGGSAGPVGSCGGKLVRTAVRIRRPAASATSARSTVENVAGRSPRSIAGIPRYRFAAPSAISAAATATLIASVTPKDPSNSRRQASNPPSSSRARSDPVSTTTSSDHPAIDENRRISPTGGDPRRPRRRIAMSARPPTHTPIAVK